MTRIGKSDPARSAQIVADARQRGASYEEILCAAWLATLRFCVTPDNHAILVLPAIARLHASAKEFGGDAWRAIEWAVGNVSSWRGETRRETAQPPSRASALWLTAAIIANDEDAAQLQVLGLCRDDGVQSTLEILCREALEPRDDPHAAIYAAQVARGVHMIAAPYRSEVLAHLGRFLSRSRRWPHFEETVPVDAENKKPPDGAAAMEAAWLLCTDDHAALFGIGEQTLFDALSLIAYETRLHDLTIGGDVHPTTHLDAVTFLYQRLPAALRAPALAKLVRANLRRRVRKGALRLPTFVDGDDGRSSAAEALHQADAETLLHRCTRVATHDLKGLRHELCRRFASHSVDEHGFKYWAAVDSLSAVVSNSVRATLWSGLGLHYAARKPTSAI